MDREVEYHPSMMKMLELIWGDGFMSPGGTDNVDLWLRVWKYGVGDYWTSVVAWVDQVATSRKNTTLT